MVAGAAVGVAGAAQATRINIMIPLNNRVESLFIFFFSIQDSVVIDSTLFRGSVYFRFYLR
jgi:hypothetical protein